MTAYEQRSYAGAAADTLLNADITNSATSFSVTPGSGTGYPDGSGGPFFVIIDWDNSKAEKVRCSGRVNDTFTVAGSGGGRGQDGTSAQAHTANAKVRHVITATDVQEANRAAANTIGKVTTKGDLLAGTGANALGRVAAGPDGAVAQADSTQTAGVKFSSTITSPTLVTPTLSGAVAGAYAPGTVLAHRQEDTAHYSSNLAASGGTATFTAAGPSLGTFQSGYVINTYIVARSTGGDGVGWAWFVTHVFREVGNAQAYTTLASSGGTSGSYNWGVTTNQWRLNATAVAADGSSVTFTATNTAATQMQYRAEHLAMA